MTSVSKPGVYFRSFSVCFGLGGEQISQCGVFLMHSHAWGALNPGTSNKRCMKNVQDGCAWGAGLGGLGGLGCHWALPGAQEHLVLNTPPLGAARRLCQLQSPRGSRIRA